MKNVFDQVDKDFADFDKKFARRSRQIKIASAIVFAFVILGFLATVGLVATALIAGPEKVGHAVGSVWSSFHNGFASGEKGQ